MQSITSTFLVAVPPHLFIISSSSTTKQNVKRCKLGIGLCIFTLTLNLFSCFCTFLVLMSVTVRPKPKNNISFKCNHNPRICNGMDGIVVVPRM